MGTIPHHQAGNPNNNPPHPTFEMEIWWEWCTRVQYTCTVHLSVQASQWRGSSCCWSCWFLRTLALVTRQTVNLVRTRRGQAEKYNWNETRAQALPYFIYIYIAFCQNGRDNNSEGRLGGRAQSRSDSGPQPAQSLCHSLTHPRSPSSPTLRATSSGSSSSSAALFSTPHCLSHFNSLPS